MTRTSMWLHVVLCAAALAFAWSAAHREQQKKGGPSSVVLLDADKGDVVELTYAWDKGRSVVRVTDGAAVVEVDRELPTKKDDKKDAKDPKKDAKDDEKEPQDGAGGQPPAALVEPPPRERARFPGGRAVLQAIEALEPLKTKRTLGVVDDARLQAMGLVHPARTLTVKTKDGRALSLELGESSYGAQGRYARVRGENVVHLVDAAIVTGLEGGPDTLLEKRPLTAELDAIGGYSVKSGERSASYVHVEKDQAARRHFARKDDPTAKDEPAGKLMTTLRNLRAPRLADAAVAAAPATVVATFVVDVAGRPQTIDVLERGDGGGHLVRSGSWTWELTATQAKELLEDVDAAFGQ